ncbi:MAG TPA: hypothetical protein V6D20_24345 [Candidatus Obscuribacterales bacterium]
MILSNLTDPLAQNRTPYLVTLTSFGNLTPTDEAEEQEFVKAISTRVGIDVPYLTGGRQNNGEHNIQWANGPETGCPFRNTLSGEFAPVEYQNLDDEVTGGVTNWKNIFVMPRQDYRYRLGV